MTTREREIINLLTQILNGDIDRAEGLARFERWLRNRKEGYW